MLAMVTGKFPLLLNLSLSPVLLHRLVAMSVNELHLELTASQNGI